MNDYDIASPSVSHGIQQKLWAATGGKECDSILPAQMVLWKTEPALQRLLQSNEDLESARRALYLFLAQQEQDLLGKGRAMPALERATARECLRVLKSILAPCHEEQVGFSTLAFLQQLSRCSPTTEMPFNQGFVWEFYHLFKGLRGRSGVGQGWLGAVLAKEGSAPVDLARLHGSKAGQARSDFLDVIGAHMWAHVERYPSGLDPVVIEKRAGNKQRILDFFDGTPGHWDNYAWQLAHLFKGRQGITWLKQLLTLTRQETKAIDRAVEHGIPFGITPYYLSLFDLDSADYQEDLQVRAQVIPPLAYVDRMIEHRFERDTYFDFMGEHDTSPVALVTRRYPTIAILKGFDTCPQICVYCQRNWEITEPMAAGAMPSRQQLDAALDWFAQHTSMIDVLVTGGDPLFLSDRRIGAIMERLAAMDHIANIRWGTRALVTMPMRVTEGLAALLGDYVEPGRRSIGVVTHIQSAAEVTPEMAQAAHRLRKQGINVYNQQVFTRHTSLRFQAVANRVAMKSIGIDPYYSFFPKAKEETREYAIPLARLLQERKEEARLLPGCFRTDEPVFNVPRLGKNHVRAWQDRELIAIRPDGRRVYLFHPWEKGITASEPWLYVDNAIYPYLQSLAAMGEDPAQYETIWYYY
jgi:lysine 2,3-aminomutase